MLARDRGDENFETPPLLYFPEDFEGAWKARAATLNQIISF